MKKFLLASAITLPMMFAQTAYAQTASQGTTESKSDASPSTQPFANGKSGASQDAPASGQTTPKAGTTQTTPGSETSQTGAASSTTPGSSASGSADTAMPGAAISGLSVKDSLMGKAVYNSQDEKIGDINDVILSSDGHATYYVIGVGGFIGMGEHNVAIDSKNVNAGGDKLMLQGYTKERLKEMPQYRPREK